MGRPLLASVSAFQSAEDHLTRKEANAAEGEAFLAIEDKKLEKDEENGELFVTIKAQVGHAKKYKRIFLQHQGSGRTGLEIQEETRGNNL